MTHKPLIPPVLTYLFHRLEARFDGRPTLLILDEAWTFLDNEMFAARLREWLKTLRKRNVAVVFATQSLADIERSTIAPALIESCPTRIFLPNDRASEQQGRAIYERFGLNARQIEILSLATAKRDYYAQTARGNRLFALGLQPIALALTTAGSPKDQDLIDRLLASGSKESFAAAFLRAKDLPWAADLLETFPGKQIVDAEPSTSPMADAATKPQRHRRECRRAEPMSRPYAAAMKATNTLTAAAPLRVAAPVPSVAAAAPQTVSGQARGGRRPRERPRRRCPDGGAFLPDRSAAGPRCDRLRSPQLPAEFAIRRPGAGADQQSSQPAAE